MFLCFDSSKYEQWAIKRIDKNFFCWIFFRLEWIENKCPYYYAQKWKNKLNLFMNHIDFSFEKHSPAENDTFLQQNNKHIRICHHLTLLLIAIQFVRMKLFALENFIILFFPFHHQNSLVSCMIHHKMMDVCYLIL